MFNHFIKLTYLYIGLVYICNLENVEEEKIQNSIKEAELNFTHKKLLRAKRDSLVNQDMNTNQGQMSNNDLNSDVVVGSLEKKDGKASMRMQSLSLLDQAASSQDLLAGKTVKKVVIKPKPKGHKKTLIYSNKKPKSPTVIKKIKTYPKSRRGKAPTHNIIIDKPEGKVIKTIVGKPRKPSYSRQRPKPRKIVKVRKKPDGTKITVNKKDKNGEKKVSVTKRKNHGQPEIERDVVYKTPKGTEKLKQITRKDPNGNIVTSEKHKVYKPKKGHPGKKVVTKTRPKHPVVRIPLPSIQKLDQDILNGNDYAKQSLDLGKRIFTRHFFDMLYNLSYQASIDAMKRNRDRPETAEVRLGPRPVILSSHWAPWSDWGRCSTSCGLGIQYRVRKCIVGKKGRVCLGSNVISKSCQLQKCPKLGKWTSWSRWSDCSATCGVGRRQRTRICSSVKSKAPSANCDGKRSMYEKCYSEPCPIGRPGRVVFSTEGDKATLTCNYDRNFVTKSVHWLTPFGETVTHSSSNHRFKMTGSALEITHSEKTDSGIYKCVVLTLKHGLLSAQASLVVVDCTSHPCHNGGVCVEQLSDSPLPYPRFICQCPAGYYGKRCHKGMGPGGIAASVIAVVAALLLILLALFACNHWNTQRVASMENDRFMGRNMSNSYTYRPKHPVGPKSISDDAIRYRKAPDREEVQRWKDERDGSGSTSSEEEEPQNLFVLGHNEILGLKDRGDLIVRKTHVTFSSDTRGATPTDDSDIQTTILSSPLYNSNKLALSIPPPLKFSGHN